MATTDIVLGKELDHKDSTVTIKYCAGMGGGPLIPFFLKNFAKLIEDGHYHHNLVGNNRSKAIYAEVDGIVVGHIVFEMLDDVSKTAWITLSAVDEKYRKRGIYTLLHKYFEIQIKSMNAKKIASYVHVNNIVRQHSCVKVGMKPVYYRMEKDL